jgi:hypothetical protein
VIALQFRLPLEHLRCSSLCFGEFELESARLLARGASVVSWHFFAVLPFRRVPHPGHISAMGGGSSKQSKCLVVGLDNSGKSTIINHLKPDAKKVRTTRQAGARGASCTQILG